MLDRHKLVNQIAYFSSKLFPDLRNQKNLAKNTWTQVVTDPGFADKAQIAKSSFLIPGWFGNLSDAFSINNDLKDYSVLAVDGSQIYPDRNFSGANCFLINVGSCLLNYGQKSFVNFFSEPKIFLPENVMPDNNSIHFSIDLVDLKREELEFKVALEKSLVNKDTVCLFDGSLIFWHLEGKQQEVKDLFLNVYIYYLSQFYKNKILHAGFISFPKSKELVNLIRLGLCRFNIADCIICHKQYNDFPCKIVDDLVDTSIARFFLKENERTTIFWSNSKITQHYPDELKPCFFYLNVGQEIVRIEIPMWIAQNNEHVDLICKVAIDQCLKGRGYPVCLAESHEQAVVKGADRDFFYHLIQKVGIEQNKRFFMSQKSLKKRGMGI
jgi:hypothetical protein